MRSQAFFALLAAGLAAMAPARIVAQGTVAPSGATVVESGPGWGVATTTTMVSARVTAIDPASRRIDLQLADGRAVGVVAGSEVRRLAEIHPGDQVNVAFAESMLLELRKKGAPVVARTQGTEVRRAPSSAPPGGVSQTETTVLADVLAVDPALGTVTLRGPQSTISLRIKDPRQLALIQPGDQVQATYSEAIAVSVEPTQ
jgi:hypothetical protein